MTFCVMPVIYTGSSLASRSSERRIDGNSSDGMTRVVTNRKSYPRWTCWRLPTTHAKRDRGRFTTVLDTECSTTSVTTTSLTLSIQT